MLLQRLCLLEWHAHPFGDRLGDVGTTHQQHADELGLTALMHGDVRDPRSDIDQSFGLRVDTQRISVSR